MNETSYPLHVLVHYLNGVSMYGDFGVGTLLFWIPLLVCALFLYFTWYSPIRYGLVVLAPFIVFLCGGFIDLVEPGFQGHSEGQGFYEIFGEASVFFVMSCFVLMFSFVAALNRPAGFVRPPRNRNVLFVGIGVIFLLSGLTAFAEMKCEHSNNGECLADVAVEKQDARVCLWVNDTHRISNEDVYGDCLFWLPEDVHMPKNACDVMREVEPETSRELGDCYEHLEILNHAQNVCAHLGLSQISDCDWASAVGSDGSMCDAEWIDVSPEERAACKVAYVTYQFGTPPGETWERLYRRYLMTSVTEADRQNHGNAVQKSRLNLILD